MKTGMNRYSSASTDQMPERPVAQPVARRAAARDGGGCGAGAGGASVTGHQIAASVRFCAPSSRA